MADIMNIQSLKTKEEKIIEGTRAKLEELDNRKAPSGLDRVREYKAKWKKEHGNIPFDEEARREIERLGSEPIAEIMDNMAELSQVREEEDRAWEKMNAREEKRGKTRGTGGVVSFPG